MIAKKVSLKAISSNYLKLKNDYNFEIFPVVKNNAYGLGAFEVTKFLSSKFKPKLFCVSTIEEIFKYQLNTILGTRFLIFDSPQTYHDSKNILYTINSFSDIKKIAKLENRNVHLYFDVGHGRGSIKTLLDIETAMKMCEESDIEIEGLYTHLRSGSDKMLINKIQDVFTIFSPKVKYCHAISSEALNISIGNSMRIGSALYGDGVNAGYKQSLTLYTTINRIVDVSQGDTFGYEPGFIVEHKGYVYEINTGYSEGFLHIFRGAKLYTKHGFLKVTNAITMNKVFAFSTKKIPLTTRVYITQPETFTIKEFTSQTGFYGPALSMVFHETTIEWGNN